MASLNRVELIGNLGRDPEVRATPSGEKVANLSLATNRRWRDAAGELQEATDWHRIVVWGDRAEAAAMYLHRGSLVYVEGRLSTRSWEDDGGVKHHTAEVVTTDIQFLDRKPAVEAHQTTEPPGPENADGPGA